MPVAGSVVDIFVEPPPVLIDDVGTPAFVFDITVEVPFILIADVVPGVVEDRFRAFPVSLIDAEVPVAGFPDVKFRELFPMLIDGAFGFAGFVVIILVFGVVVAAVEDDILGVVVISVGAIVVVAGIGVIVVVAGIGVVVAAAGGGVVVVVIVGIGEITGVKGVDDDIVVVGVPDDDRALFVLRDDGPGDSLTALVDVPTPFTMFEDVCVCILFPTTSLF